jgi:hypothetical protein
MWQGWGVTLAYVIVLLGALRLFPETYWLCFVISTLILLVICYKKGEKPKWSWGKHPNT